VFFALCARRIRSSKTASLRIAVSTVMMNVFIYTRFVVIGSTRQIRVGFVLTAMTYLSIFFIAIVELDVVVVVVV